ncbi:MAG TPA: hypothetical protein DIS62_00465 [Candidatus Kerfeldbacteria bacterium]|nr:hypothetical protein [Candidatus Kerfeldbacteria bacterium]
MLRSPVRIRSGPQRKNVDFAKQNLTFNAVSHTLVLRIVPIKSGLLSRQDCESLINNLLIVSSIYIGQMEDTGFFEL